MGGSLGIVTMTMLVGQRRQENQTPGLSVTLIWGFWLGAGACLGHLSPSPWSTGVLTARIE